jgi:hypothetical protein
MEPSAFGSLLWGYQTGLTYLSLHSDLDILWPVPSAFDVLSLVFGIAEVQRDAPLRIDGEVVFPDGSASIGASCGWRTAPPIGVACWSRPWRAFGYSRARLCSCRAPRGSRCRRGLRVHSATIRAVGGKP